MTFYTIAFAALLGISGLAASADSAAQAAVQTKPKTIADIHKTKAALAGKTVRMQGKVIKVNNGIRGYNFVHIQDGTGGAGSNTLILRSKDTANIGDKIAASGVVVVDRDFGSGYFYPLLIEEVKITPRK